MSTNCLVTKLKGVVDNPDLEKFNEIKFLKVAFSDTNVYRLVSISSVAGKTVAVRTSDGGNHLAWGDNYETTGNRVEITGSINGYFRVYGGDYDLILENKSDVNKLSVLQSEVGIVSTCYFLNLDRIIKYMPTLISFTVACDGDKVYDISSFDMNRFHEVNIYERNFSGDITNFSLPNYNYNSSIFLRFYASQCYGNLNKLISETPTPVFGMALSNTMSSSCDLSLIHNGAKVYDVNGNITYTWEHERPSSAYMFKIAGGVNLGNYVDAMLINMAKCESSPYSSWDNTIKVYGTHDPENTQAVAAIATIKEKGWRVFINDEEL